MPRSSPTVKQGPRRETPEFNRECRRQTSVLRFFPSIFCVLLFGFLTAASRGESIVSSGFKSFSSGGSSAALSTWTRQSRVLTASNISQLAGDLKKLEATLGTCSGFDIISKQPLSPQDSQVLAVAHFSYGSLFARFIVFQDNVGQEYVNGLWFSTDPSEVFPERSGPSSSNIRRGP